MTVSDGACAEASHDSPITSVSAAQAVTNIRREFNVIQSYDCHSRFAMNRVSGIGVL